MGKGQTPGAKAEAADASDLPDGLDTPAELARREDRLKGIAAAKAEIERRAKERKAVECAAYEAKLAARKIKTLDDNPLARTPPAVVTDRLQQPAVVEPVADLHLRIRLQSVFWTLAWPCVLWISIRRDSARPETWARPAASVPSERFLASGTLQVRGDRLLQVLS